MKHIRPITFRVMKDTLNLLASRCTFEEFCSKASFTESRAREVVFQLVNMGLLKAERGLLSLTDAGRALLNAFKIKNYRKIHEILLEYEPYRVMYYLLKDRTCNYAQIFEQTGFNPVVVDTLVRLMRKAGISVVRDASGGFYIEKSEDEVEYELFVDVLKEEYDELLKNSRYARYVEIPALRWRVQEKLRISSSAFDNLFKKFVKETVAEGAVTLSPAPKSIMKGRGVIISGRHYYFIYMR